MNESDLQAEVAAILAQANRSVDVEFARDGLRIDIKTEDENRNELIIECKAFHGLVGLRSVREFASKIDYLREATPTLKAWLVSTNGFTINARRALERHGLDGKTIGELRAEFSSKPEELRTKVKSFKKKAKDEITKQRRIFVLMPFDPAMDDVFILGIRWVATALGAVAVRADEIEHSGEIVLEIRKAIDECDVVVADTTGGNPNVFYEVGFAHALKKPTILICRRGEKIPFDLQGTKHLIYPNIIQLRQRLKARLRAVLPNLEVDGAKRQAPEKQ